MKKVPILLKSNFCLKQSNDLRVMQIHKGRKISTETTVTCTPAIPHQNFKTRMSRHELSSGRRDQTKNLMHSGYVLLLGPSWFHLGVMKPIPVLIDHVEMDLELNVFDPPHYTHQVSGFNL